MTDSPLLRQPRRTLQQRRTRDRQSREGDNERLWDAHMAWWDEVRTRGPQPTQPFTNQNDDVDIDDDWGEGMRRRHNERRERESGGLANSRYRHLFRE